MDEMIQYVGAITLGTFSLPLALGLGWLSLRLVFDWMPAANRQRVASGAPTRRLTALPVAAAVRR